MVSSCFQYQSSKVHWMILCRNLKNVQQLYRHNKTKVNSHIRYRQKREAFFLYKNVENRRWSKININKDSREMYKITIENWFESHKISANWRTDTTRDIKQNVGVLILLSKAKQTNLYLGSSRFLKIEIEIFGPWKEFKGSRRKVSTAVRHCPFRIFKRGEQNLIEAFLERCNPPNVRACSITE